MSDTLDTQAEAARRRKAAIISTIVIVCVLFLDQFTKFVVKLNMELGEHIPLIGSWGFTFHENEGMAFSLKLGDGEVAKLILTVFRIIAAGFLIWYLTILIKKKHRLGYIVAISLILAGAMGNIIDSVFYGVVFSASGYWQGMSNPGHLASFLPPDPPGAYGKFLHGLVVDMIRTPIRLPASILPGRDSDLTLFDAIYNVADSSIFIGITSILLFFRKELMKEDKAKEAKEGEEKKEEESKSDIAAKPEADKA